VITAPNIVLAEIVDSGKSPLATYLYTRSRQFGRRAYLLGDPKGEHTPVAEAVGDMAMAIRPGHGLPAHLNPLDEGYGPHHLTDLLWITPVALPCAGQDHGRISAARGGVMDKKTMTAEALRQFVARSTKAFARLERREVPADHVRSPLKRGPALVSRSAKPTCTTWNNSSKTRWVANSVSRRSTAPSRSPSC
jgi:hypothetical protein